MTIRYIAKDPQSLVKDERVIEPHNGRLEGRATFRYRYGPPEGMYELDSEEFLFWQCREAVLRGLDSWETITGPLSNWAGEQKTLDLIPKGADSYPNAFYDRRSLQFFEFRTTPKPYFSGASTDIVTHELGHAILDVIRPDLWDSPFIETGALHEAFGDLSAIFHALSDRQTRIKFLAEKDLLKTSNFVETVGPDLADGVRQGIEEGLLPYRLRNAAAPRQSFNTFKWISPLKLRREGDPGELLNEIHSFGQIFSGAVYQVILNIFQKGSKQNEAGLFEAMQTTGKLLVSACKQAPIVPRFFKSVGEIMVKLDIDRNAGRNTTAIKRGFSRHGIDLELEALLVPTESLSGRGPKLTAAHDTDIITWASRRDIMQKVGESRGQQLSIRATEIGDSHLAMAQHRHYVPLDGVAACLKGVVALVEEEILIGEKGGRAAILGETPSIEKTNSEVQQYVSTLLDTTAIDVGIERDCVPTHQIVKVGKQKLLKRIRFS